jgi:hydroxymethylpyrimidine pyrophosphatase-like HAD family hydrolase|tara:strand:- start:46 stop:420 length:375 start_codon:yes stop_codon:yes gene_type:complete
MKNFKEVRPKTIFCDIDGTLVKHLAPCHTSKPSHKMELLPGTLEKLEEWDIKGYNLILTTGRKESCRKMLEKQLAEVGIMYDMLIMGIGGGVRVVINDLKPYGDYDTAKSVNLSRDEGIKNLNI